MFAIWYIHWLDFSIYFFKTRLLPMALIIWKVQSFFHNNNSECYKFIRIAYQQLATLSLFKTSFSTTTLFEMFLIYKKNLNTLAL